jgi:hypothetical protein
MDLPMDALTEAMTRDLPPDQRRLARRLWRGPMATDTVLREIAAMRSGALPGPAGAAPR